MLSQNVNAALEPCRLMVTRSALSPTYRALEIGPEMVRSFASYALLEVYAALGVTETVVVEAGAFLGVVASLPANVELVLTVEAGALAWSCGPARGRLALLPAKLPAQMEYPSDMSSPYIPTREFVKALELGSLSCDGEALGNNGMYGVVIYCSVEGWTTICSTDNTSISCCQLSLDGTVFSGWDGMMTLPPEGVELLCSLMSSGGMLYVTSTGWYYQDDTRFCLVKEVPALMADITAIRSEYMDDEPVVVPIPTAQVDAFIKRTSALTENRRNAVVGMSAGNGKLSLAFKEGVSSTDEVYLAESLEGLPDLPEIRIGAVHMARVLKNVTEIVLNHLERSIVILRDPATEFSYMLSGKVK